MEVSDQQVDLNSYFPFSCSEKNLFAKAYRLGKCVKYSTGETVLFSGSPAKHCGLILNGQAIAFKMDDTGRRYRLCLDEGCWIGLETITPNNTYTSKITALTELIVFFWNNDGIAQLIATDPDFAAGLHVMDEGRAYQEQWLIPETDVTDPVLCSQQTHWISILAPAFVIIPLLLLALAVTSTLVRRYTAAWLLFLPILGAAGTLLYRQITERSNERVIVTSKNLIVVPKTSDAEMMVTRLSGLQSVTVHQNVIERMFDMGRISLESESRSFTTPMLKYPEKLAVLIHDFAVRNSLGRVIPLRDGKSAGRKTFVRVAPAADDPETLRADARAAATPFNTIKFHAHWALLVRMAFKGLVVFCVALYAAYYFRASAYADTIRKVLLVIAGLAVCWIVYQFFAWRNHIFIIEEDCVKDYSRKPFSAENLSVAMNHKIQSVSFEKSGFFQVLLNYGTVYILAGEGELDFEYVSDPQKVQQLIMDTCSRYEAKLRMEEEERRKVYISGLFNEIRAEASGSPIEIP